MTDYNNQPYQGQPYAQAAAINAFNPERVNSGGFAISKQQQQHQQSLAGKRPRRLRSTQGAAHYGNGQKGKKGPGANNRVEYHDRKTAAPIFLQSKLLYYFLLSQISSTNVGSRLISRLNFLFYSSTKKL